MENKNPHAIAGAGVEGVLPDASTHSEIPVKTPAESIVGLIYGFQSRAYNIRALAMGIERYMDDLQSEDEHAWSCVNSFATMVGSQATELLDLADNLDVLSLRMKREAGNG